MAPNVVMIFIDTLSRRRFHELLPETVKFFEEREDSTNEYMRLHAFARRTFENVLGFNYGMTRDDYMD